MKEDGHKRDLAKESDVDLWNIMGEYWISFLKENSWRRILYSFCDFCMGDKQKTFSLRSLYFFLEGNPNKKREKGKKKGKMPFSHLQ